MLAFEFQCENIENYYEVGGKSVLTFPTFEMRKNLKIMEDTHLVDIFSDHGSKIIFWQIL